MQVTENMLFGGTEKNDRKNGIRSEVNIKGIFFMDKKPHRKAQKRPMQLLTPSEAAEILQVSNDQIMGYIHSGELTASRLSKRTYRIHPNHLEQFVKKTRRISK